MFLYPKSIVNAEVHTETLKRLSETTLVDALDCWVWRTPERAREEIAILKECGKVVNYNVGDRFGELPSFPASTDASERERAYGLYMREIEAGLSIGSRKIVIGSGPDIPTEHTAAVERFFEFVLRLLSNLPRDVSLVLEPTDWDVDKRFLFGPLGETVDFIKAVRMEGYENFGLLLDQCHVPIMHETLESALEKGSCVLEHIHLGNAVIRDKNSEYYGDKHPAWNYPCSEYTDDDGARFVKMLRNIGYTDRDGATVTFEMRPYEGVSPEESLARFVSVFRRGTSE
jgi:sugar phosphate isomerase/epimerase